jgi:hypothetical protein
VSFSVHDVERDTINEILFAKGAVCFPIYHSSYFLKVSVSKLFNFGSDGYSEIVVIFVPNAVSYSWI